MTGVEILRVDAAEGEQRLDRWFRRRFPEITHARLEKLLRTGQIRVDGKRAKAAQRLAEGQEIRIPPLIREVEPAAAPRPAAARPAGMRPAGQNSRVTAAMEALRDAILYMDDEVIALDKPAGLAVQGGGGIAVHIDGLLEHLQFDARERPRLVHRLDQETSGVLLIGRTMRAARRLTEAFRERDTRKEYWCVTVGVPGSTAGRIDLPLSRSADNVGRVDAEAGLHALTDYRVLAAAAEAAFVAMWPLTGRTHQLRLHAAAIGTPILGDGKYGGRQTAPAGLPPGLSRQLHLHARRIELPHPTGGTIDVMAPLPVHMAATFAHYGFPAEPLTDRPFDPVSNG
jgi:23S rRNA pseudouridine955/2504/2580 synthase